MELAGTDQSPLSETLNCATEATVLTLLLTSYLCPHTIIPHICLGSLLLHVEDKHRR